MIQHGLGKELKCKLCSFESFTEWRLRKHIKGHKETKQKRLSLLQQLEEMPI